MRTFLYKLTSDRGGAPCAPPPHPGESPFLTIAICKPAIRRTAQPGDRLLGVTSQSLVAREGYPGEAIIYAAVVSRTLDGRDYYAEPGPFLDRPDCIYRFDPADAAFHHSGRTRLHQDPAYMLRDVGRQPYYKNARTLLCDDFRYFGVNARPIPQQMRALLQTVQSLGQGHRVFCEDSAEWGEVDALWKRLWKLATAFTPARVESEAYGHAPRGPAREEPGIAAATMSRALSSK